MGVVNIGLQERQLLAENKLKTTTKEEYRRKCRAQKRVKTHNFAAR